jgi:hypothetical protein
MIFDYVILVVLILVGLGALFILGFGGPRVRY